MGEVYRARDTRLGRDVAIKVLPAGYTSDPEARRRLEREARAISSLSHPNVCALFDVGHERDVDFLVMEYLEGETLASRLSRGPLPPEQVLRVGTEIASALAAAHRRGVIHRDLKPGNVMLTRAGARLLDFGLAKPASPSATELPAEATLTAPITARGTLVGTFPYMSPEQVEGREIDARSDIFSLGGVLYEMATGRRAFDDKTTASLIAAILERDPAPVSTFQPFAPVGFDDIVRGCLAKDPEDRWQTAQDVKLQLDSLQRRMGTGGTVDSMRGVVVPPSVRARGRIARVTTMFALIAAGAAALLFWPRADAPSSSADTTPLVRAPLPPPRGHAFLPNNSQISPDGSRVAFIAAGANGVSALWTTSLASGQYTPIGGTDGATGPFWSPDSRWIGFFARGRLLKVEPGGAGIQEICPVPFNAGFGAWAPNDQIVFSGSVLGPLLRIPSSGGDPLEITRIPKDMPGETHRFPQFLADGQRFLYLASWTNQQRGGIYLGNLSGGEGELVTSDIRSRVLLAGSHLVFADGGVLYAQPFDQERARLTGERRALLRNEVVADFRFGDLPVSLSRNGILLYQSPVSYNSRLVWFDRQGDELNTAGEPGFAAPILSPDGRRAAVSHDREGGGAWNTTILDLGRGVSYALPQEGIHTAHDWSPDGQWIYYSTRRERNGIHRRRADGSGAEETLFESDANLMMNSVAPTGPARVLFMDFAAGSAELRELNPVTKASRVVAVGAEGVYSPDGEWVAYVSPSGVVLSRVTGPEARVQISRGIGAQIRWVSMNELFYITPDRKLMVVPLTPQNGTIEPGTPRVLFQTRVIEPRLVLFQYDTHDGQRFLINSLPRDDAGASLTLLVNWIRSLER